MKFGFDKKWRFSLGNPKEYLNKDSDSSGFLGWKTNSDLKYKLHGMLKVF